MRFIGLLVLGVVLCSQAFAGVGVAQGACTGAIPSLGYYFAYAYQYAFTSDGQVLSEVHQFQFAGFLEGMDEAKIVKGTEHHVIYEKGDFALAVPYQSGFDLRFKDLTDPEDRWIDLCRF